MDRLTARDGSGNPPARVPTAGFAAINTTDPRVSVPHRVVFGEPIPHAILKFSNGTTRPCTGAMRSGLSFNC